MNTLVRNSAIVFATAMALVTSMDDVDAQYNADLDTSESPTDRVSGSHSLMVLGSIQNADCNQPGLVNQRRARLIDDDLHESDPANPRLQIWNINAALSGPMPPDASGYAAPRAQAIYDIDVALGGPLLSREPASDIQINFPSHLFAQVSNNQPTSYRYTFVHPGIVRLTTVLPGSGASLPNIGLDGNPARGTIVLDSATVDLKSTYITDSHPYEEAAPEAWENSAEEIDEFMAPLPASDDTNSEAPGDSLVEQHSEATQATAWISNSDPGDAQRRYTQTRSVNLASRIRNLDPVLGQFVRRQLRINNLWHMNLSYDADFDTDVRRGLESPEIQYFETDPCWTLEVPTNPNFARTGGRGGGFRARAEDDQWAIKRVGYTDDKHSAWNQVPDTAAPVVVAVIDTGLDWHHLDISHESIWRNEGEVPDNGIDDDNNGYVDDLIGWDFVAGNNKPWDFDGHGTFVTGIIAATRSKDAGIAGINPRAKIMVLKGIDNFGTTRASYIAEAIVYAVDNGARVINLSAGGPQPGRMAQAAIDYAYEKGVLVVAASGNDGVELDENRPGHGDHVLTVGATEVDDRAAAFSDFGDEVDLVAPGVHVLSLRARYTDANYRPWSEQGYVVGTNYVGEDERYLRASGTSFSAPIVAATASLLISKDPELTAADVQRILVRTATDVDSAGRDKHTGHGLLNAQAALSVDPDFSITAEITALEPVPRDAPESIRVKGTIDASRFKRAWMQIGSGENPSGWRYVGQKRKLPIVNGTLGTIPINQFSGSERWQVVINVEHRNGVVKRAVYPIIIR